MDKAEFLQTLRMALTGKVSAQIINDNLTYYEDYINTQVRLGRTEEAVLNQLGNPRLIAKTIVSAVEVGNSKYEHFDETDTREKNTGKKFDFWHFSKWPWWGYMLIPVAVIAILLLLALVVWLLTIIMPVIVIFFIFGVIAFLIFKLFKDWLK